MIYDIMHSLATGIGRCFFISKGILMLGKIKQAWRDFCVVIIAAAILAAYLIGKKRGEDDQKARENKAVLQNVQRAAGARTSLRNPDTVRRLRNKYKR